MGIKSRLYGVLPDGNPAYLYTLKSGSVEVDVTNYGCIITSVRVPDRNGLYGDVVLGLDSLNEYLDAHPYFGCVVGRYANRIANGHFKLDGVDFQLAKNRGENHLHGGVKGFDKKLWEPSLSEDRLVLRLISPDGDEGYPGTLTAKVTYWVNSVGGLTIDYEASPDKPTIVNLTNHSYFNLAGHGDVLGHELRINADNYTPSRADLIPTGEVQSVDGLPLDFREPTTIGSRIDSRHEQMLNGGDYDHNFVLNGESGKLRLVASVFDPSSGRRMDVSTTQPGLQLYTGNSLNGSLKGKSRVYTRRSGLCLETQHYPDSPNRPEFPSTVLRPGESYRERTTFAFRVEQ